MTTTTPAAPVRPAPLDFTRLTLGEVAKLEQLSGLSLDRIGDEDAPKGKLLAAMAYVASRRRGAPLEWEMCLDLTVAEANELLGLAELTEPEPPAQQATTEYPLTDGATLVYENGGEADPGNG
jgi:hypothetical protein